MVLSPGASPVTQTSSATVHLRITVVTDGHDSSVNQSINKAFVTHTHSNKARLKSEAELIAGWQGILGVGLLQADANVYNNQPTSFTAIVQVNLR